MKKYEGGGAEWSHSKIQETAIILDDIVAVL